MMHPNTSKESDQITAAYTFNQFFSNPDNRPFIEPWGNRDNGFAGLKSHLDNKLFDGQHMSFFSKDIRIIAIGTAFGPILIYDDKADGIRNNFGISFPDKCHDLFVDQKIVTNDPWVLRFILGIAGRISNIGLRLNNVTKAAEESTLERVKNSNAEILDAWENFRSWPQAPDFAFLPVAPENDGRFIDKALVATMKFNTLLKEVNNPTGLPFMITSDELKFCQATNGFETLVACFGSEGYAVCIINKKPVKSV